MLFADERFRLETPRPATPDAVAAVLAEVAGHWKGTDAMGVTFPGVVRQNVIGTAANLHPDWVGVDASALFTEHTGRRATVLNDADAAGVAEIAFGAGRNVRGVVLLLTFGTGIGSALFLNGVLVPNTEFGHLELNGADAELHASDRIREEQGLHWEQWAGRVQDYLHVVERLLSPDLIILGGGVSKKADRFLPLRQGRYACGARRAAEQRRDRRRGDGHHRPVLAPLRARPSRRRGSAGSRSPRRPAPGPRGRRRSRARRRRPARRR